MQHACAIFFRWCAAVILGIGVVGALAPGAQAYPATVCTVTVTPRAVVGGSPVTVTGTANKAIDWTFTFKDAGGSASPRLTAHASSRARVAASGAAQFRTQVARGHGKTFTHVFHTPKVSKTLHLEVVSSCGGTTPVTVSPPGTGTGGAGGNPGHNGHNTNGGPGGGGGGGLLPNTGGPAWWLALLGLGLLVGGSVSMRRGLRH